MPSKKYKIENSSAGCLTVEGLDEVTERGYVGSPMEVDDDLRYDGIADGGALNEPAHLRFRSLWGYDVFGGGTGFRNSADVPLTGTINGQALTAAYENRANSTTFAHLKINGTNYYH